MIVNSADWTVQFAETLKKRDIAVMIADRNYHSLKIARLADIPVYYGEVLSEETEFNLELTRYNKLLAATDNKDYNTLLCSHFAHSFGRERVFQLGEQGEDEHERRQITETIRGRIFASEDLTYWNISRLYRQGWRFRTTRVDKNFNMGDILKEQENGGSIIIGVIRGNGKLQFQPPEEKSLKDDDIVILFEKDAQKSPERLAGSQPASLPT